MILDSDIERKDFSLPFHNIISKTTAISQAIMLESEDSGAQSELELAGWHYVLQDVVNDLEVINKTLYGG